MLESLTDEQRAEIGAGILAGRIIEATRRIKEGCGMNRRQAADLNRSRYRQLSPEDR